MPAPSPTSFSPPNSSATTRARSPGPASAKKGFLEEADKGTLFLDEIGELALPIQVKLLRVLQEGEFFRLGSTKNQKVDVRIIAATNKDLLSEMKKGNFRKDLFYRLNMSSVYLIPLRERKGDIPLLCQHFLKKFNEQNQKNIQKISEPAMRLLNQYDYPGNVRELMNIINSAIIIESGNELLKKSLPQYFLENSNFKEDSATGIAPADPGRDRKRADQKCPSAYQGQQNARRRRYWASPGSICWPR